MEGANGNWRPVQGDASGMNMDPAASGDWRQQLQPEARQRIVNKIMDTLQRHLPIYGQEGLGELRKIAQRFEEKIYTAATNQSDYLRKISLKMLTMETKTQNSGVANQMPSNPSNQNPPDPGSHVLQQQAGQSLPISLPNQSQTRQQTLTPGIQNNLASAAVQGSTSLASMVPAMNGLGQSISSISQTSNLQSMSAIPQNLVNTTGQSISSNIYPNSQRQIQGKQQQQPLVSLQHQQQSQNSHLYPQQLQQQQQILKSKLSHPSLMQSQLQQQQQQQQPLLSTTQLQSSQQPVMQMPSSLQSSQTSLQQAQPPMMQSVPHSGHQQNQPNLLQQSSSPLLQQHPHTVLRQQQSQPSTGHQQASSLQQQSAAISQQSVLPLQQQQQQLSGNQSNISNTQLNHLLGPQSSIPDIQQQQRRLAVQQNNLMSMQQSQQMLNQQNMSLHQQVVPQSNISGLQQIQSQQHLQQQSQLLGSQPNIANMHQHHHAMHMMQSQKTAAQQQPQQQQQQVQQTGTSLMQSQGQQPQPLPAQQQLMSQIQSQPMQLQQQIPMQQQANPSQREMQQMQQRLQASGVLLQPHNAFEPQKPLYQSQRGLPEASSNSMDSTAQTSQQGPDWQEEIYQKLQSMRELYFADLNDVHQRIVLKCQQHEALIPPGKHSEQLENMKKIKHLMDRLLTLLQMPKNNIQPGLKDKLQYFEKQMFNVIASNRKKNIPPQMQGQQQFPHPSGNTQSLTQQPSSQALPVQQHDSHGNQMPLIVQGSVTSMQSTAVSSIQNGSMPLSTHVGVPATQQNIMNSLPPCSNIDSSQGGALTSLQEGAMGSLQHGGMGSLQQTTFNASTQANMNSLAQTSNAMQPNTASLQPNANVIQNQHVKQENQGQQLIQSQQIKQQMQQRQMQQKQILQQQTQMQQQYQQQQKQPQSAQLQAHQIPQLHQLNEMNDLKVRQASVIKSGLFPSPFPGGQRQTYQQLKPGASFPISSPQNLQAPSPQISQHSSPQVEQGPLSSLPKPGTPLQSTNSPFVVPSPSTPIAPSPLPGDHDKPLSGISSVSNAANMGHQQISVAPTQAQSLAVGTPGISASPLLAEYIGSDGGHANAGAVFPVKSNATERPIERLVKAAQSLSPEVLSSSVSDIGSVVSMIDRIAGSAPGNGSRAAIGEDLVAMTKCRLQARSFMSQDGSTGAKKMKRQTNAMPLNAVSSAGSVNENLKQLSTDVAELESTATSRVKRPKVEATHALLEEIREINQQLIDTVVDVTDEDTDSIVAAADGGEGTVVKCSYCAVAVSPSLKSQFASAQVSPISPLHLLVPSSYPSCSPILLDKIPGELSKETEDLSAKAKSRFNVSLRGLSQPMSLGEMVRTWDFCARKVVEEYARQNGGGSFSSRYGSWENCVTV